MNLVQAPGVEPGQEHPSGAKGFIRPSRVQRPLASNGLGSWLRSSGLSVPNGALYQAELYPDKLAILRGIEPRYSVRQTDILAVELQDQN